MTLDSLEALVARLGQRIGASPADLPTFGHTEDGARPHVEGAPVGWAYIVVERGVELAHERFATAAELLYRIFKDVSFSVACAWAARHPVPGRDFRRGLFARQVELLGMLAPEWGMRREREVEAWLRLYPYRDEPAES